MKTAELSGAQLDYWVAKAEFADSTYVTVDESYVNDLNFHPSTDWSQGGPIIERIGITIEHGASRGEDWWDWRALAPASPDVAAFGLVEMEGDTPLIAAMRAYIASKFGEEV